MNIKKLLVKHIYNKPALISISISLLIGITVITIVGITVIVPLSNAVYSELEPEIIKSGIYYDEYVHHRSRKAGSVALSTYSELLDDKERIVSDINAEIDELNANLLLSLNESELLEQTLIELEQIVAELAGELIMQQNKLEEYFEEIERLTNNRIAIPAGIAHHSQSQLSYMGDFTMTSYCNCVRCCGRWSPYHHTRVGTDYAHRTSGGYVPTVGLTVAVDRTVIPMGTWLYIEDYGIRRAEDTGSGVKGNWIDLYADTHEEALQIGRRTVTVWIINRDE
jgi:3D (Asp-Asp-Asp) domain-containing protein